MMSFKCCQPSAPGRTPVAKAMTMTAMMLSRVGGAHKLLRFRTPVLSRGKMSDQPPPKKSKTEEDAVLQTIADLSEFEVVRILTDSGQKKLVCVEGRLTNRPGKAVLWLEKLPFSLDNVKALCSRSSQLKYEYSNNIYGSYFCSADPKHNEIKTTITYPATDAHINKFLKKPTYLIEETPELYSSITLPHLEKEQFDCQWVYNILDGKSEVDRIFFDDPDPVNGFVLIPDLKWSGKQMEDFYVLALVRRHGIKSLRDLTEEHLPLLRNIQTAGIKAIQDKYGLASSQLRVYIHYQPTFYHLHVHMNTIQHEPGGIYCERSHLLSSVINNIELYGDYYKNAKLTFVVSEGQNLCTEFMNKGIIQKIEEPVNSN